jgi:hypothetical protein
MQPGASGHYGALPHLGCVSGVGAVKSLDLLVRGKSPQARWLSVNTWGCLWQDRTEMKDCYMQCAT